MSELPRESQSGALPPPTTGSDYSSSTSGSPSQPGQASEFSGSTYETTGSTYESSDSTFESSDSGSGSKAEAAKGEAKQVADTAVQSGKEVAATAKDETKNVAAETKQQAASLFDTLRSEVGQQASTSQSRIADTLHSLSKELGGMASSSEESGPLTDLAHKASRRGGEVAHWLQNREPADVLEEVRSYARRKPGTFLLLCGLAGVVAGRLTRSAVASRTSLDSPDRDSGSAGDRAASAHYAATPPQSQQPQGYDTSTYTTAPATDTTEGPSTGVYGGSLETTEPATTDSGYVSDPPLPGSGFVGTTGRLDDPSGDPNR